MRPTVFPEANTTFAKDQPEYLPLPAHVSGDETITCWRLAFWERMRVLFTGTLWVRQLNFGAPLQPQCVQVENPFTDGVSREGEP